MCPSIQVQCCPFIMQFTCCYKGTILQRNYRKITILWSFSYNSFVKFHGKILKNFVRHNMTIYVVIRCVIRGLNYKHFCQCTIFLMGEGWKIQIICRNIVSHVWTKPWENLLISGPLISYYGNKRYRSTCRDVQAVCTIAVCCLYIIISIYWVTVDRHQT